MLKMIFPFPKIALLLAFVVSSIGVYAQPGKDTFSAQVYNGRLWLMHPVQKGEKLSDISRRYGVESQGLAKENGIAFAAALTEGATLRVPLNSQNLSDSFSPGDIPVVFPCQGRENFVVLAGSIERTFRDLQALNPGLRQYCTGGALVLIGYFRKKEGRQDEVIPETDALPPDGNRVAMVDIIKDTPLVNPNPPTAEADFQILVDNGVPLTEQAGPVVFFAGGSGDVYYAFHNTVSHGTILRLRNPANGRVVYAKVIGKLPVAKKYYKALAAVSENARKALGSLGDARMWCEVAHAGY